MSRVDAQSFGIKIRHAREAAGISQDELAQRVGKDQQVISEYETAKRKMFVNDLPELALALGVSITYFFEDAVGDLDDVILREFHQLPTQDARETAIQLVRVLRGYAEKE